MRRPVILLLLLTLSVTALGVFAGRTSARAYRGASPCWTKVATGTSHDLNDACRAGASVIAVGDAGTVRSWDGTTWTAKPAAGAADLYAVTFADATHGWAGGVGGTIMRTTDGGASWLAGASGSDRQINDLCFLDPQHGWAAGGVTEDTAITFLRTADGGATWSPQAVTWQYGVPDNVAVRGISFGDALHGIAVGSLYRSGGGSQYLILRTADGGATWAEVAYAGRPYFDDDIEVDYWSDLYGVQMLDATHAVALAHETGYSNRGGFKNAELVLGTSDGGVSWGFAFATTDRPGEPTDVAFADANDGWIGGDAGEVIRTTDGGATWHRETAGLPAVGGLAFSDALNGVAVCAGGASFKTGNGWDDATRPVTSAPRSASVAYHGTVALAYRVTDPDSPICRVTITLRNSRGKVVKKVLVGWRHTGRTMTQKVHCPYPRGTYTFTVVAVDAATNGQSKAGHNTLHIH